MRRRKDTAGRNPVDLVQAAVLLSLGLFLLSGAWAARAQERITGQVIRLHVLAASDRPEDQARKLRVRDAVLSRTEGYLRDAESRDEAERVLRERLPDLRTAAAAVLAREGCADGVRVELAETDFPTRVYDSAYTGTGAYAETAAYVGTAAYTKNGVYAGTGPDDGERDGFALPAGRYLALRVVIGPGAGRNWWCVVFPPLCGGGTEKYAAAQLEEKTTGKNAAAQSEVEATEKSAVERSEEKTTGKNAADHTEEKKEAKTVEEPETVKPRTKEPETATPETEQPVTAKPEQVKSSRKNGRETAEAPAASATLTASAPPAASAVRGLPAASQRYEVRFRVVELWGRIRAVLS